MRGRILELESEKLLKKGKAQGIAEGIAQGVDRVSKLYLHLMNVGRNEEMKKAMEDPELREELMKSLGM